MRFFQGQVHVLEIIALCLISILTLAMGYSLPLLAGLFLLFWPLLLIQLVFEGLFLALFAAIAGMWRRARAKPAPPPPPPVEPRRGVARYLWFLPMVTLTLGYGRYVIETGKWFL